MPSDAINRQTRLEWRELGFFYDRDDSARCWRIVGSRAGLLQFRDVLGAYAADPRNVEPSEHEHYGPYMYLKLMTWPAAGFDEDSIHGTLDDLRRLALVIESKIGAAARGTVIRIQDEFPTNCSYALQLEVRDDDFDPPSADAALPPEVAG